VTVRAYVGLGSNLGDRLRNLQLAIARLDASRLRVVGVSSVYETEALDAPPPNYLNAVCAVDTTLSAEALLALLLQVERALGRERTVQGAPREIDLDLLLHGDTVAKTPTLTLPHPRLTERAFVLTPLLEIAPAIVDPSSGKPLAAMLPQARGHARRITERLDASRSTD
jgi:2-amino-4-hydroxy-6-hydroxymethyldihydropteridine diphosphokinase